MSPVRHPAKFTDSILDTIRPWLPVSGLVLDPFAGTGRVHRLATPTLRTVGVEIEPEWATLHPHTVVGNALALPFGDATFDAIATSPCLEASELVLTADLRWVEAGAVQEGDRLLAFDEFAPGVKPGGQPMRRRFRIAEVTQGGLAQKRCVRVVLADGSSVVCSYDHPWLAQRYADNSRGAKWVTAENMLGQWALKQVEPWVEGRSYKHGWLAGMFDGEGSLSFGVHGSPKLMMCQNPGPVLDQAEGWLRELGFKVNRLPRTTSKVENLYVINGWPGLLRALGELRPVRLLSKLDRLDVASRAIQPWRVQVVAVEHVGEQTIATLTTSTGTYIGQGFLHHNTYGNRMADHHEARDGSRRMTYRHTLGRPLHPDNSGAMQWGCVAPGTKILTEDMRWVPVEDLRPGDPIIGFDEAVPEGPREMRNRGRRWRHGQIEAVEVAPRECVEVHFDDGHSVVCTVDHPWLASPGAAYRRWVKAIDLRPGDSLGVYFEDWDHDTSLDGHYMRAIRERRVVEIVPVGEQDVVLMGTSCSTYVADGMGSHNTAYREFHEQAWDETVRVLRPGGRFILNCADHIRRGELQTVTAWHILTLSMLGLDIMRATPVDTPGMRCGQNGQVRLGFEWVIVMDRDAR